MKRKVLLMINVMLWFGLFSACSSDDDDINPLLLNEWVLVSYGNESSEVIKEANGYYYSITFHSDGTYSGYAYGNQRDGKYECNGHEIHFYDCVITALYVKDSDPDNFYLKHWRDVNTYTVSDTELRLFYSINQYFKFRNKNK